MGTIQRNVENVHKGLKIRCNQAVGRERQVPRFAVPTGSSDRERTVVLWRPSIEIRCRMSTRPRKGPGVITAGYDQGAKKPLALWITVRGGLRFQGSGKCPGDLVWRSVGKWQRIWIFFQE